MHSLRTYSIREIILQLLKNNPSSLTLLNQPDIKTMTDEIKDELITTHRVLFLAIFKDHLIHKKIPLESIIAGGFCGEANHLVLLSDKDHPTLTLWSVADCKPLDSKEIILAGTFSSICPSILKTSHSSNRFLIHESLREKVQVWHISEEASPSLVKEESVILSGDPAVSLSSDGKLLCLSLSRPIAKHLKDPQLRIKRKNSIESDIDINHPKPFSSSVCMSGNGHFSTTMTHEGSIVYWDLTGDEPIQAKLLSDEGYTAEALDESGKFLITRRNQSNIYSLLNCSTEHMYSFYKKEAPSNPFTPHEQVEISFDGNLATLSLAYQDPVICYLTHRTHTTIPLKEEPLEDNEINFIQLDRTNELLLSLKNRTAYVFSLVDHVASLSLNKLLLILKLKLYGNKILTNQPYSSLYEKLDDTTQEVLRKYFDLSTT